MKLNRDYFFMFLISWFLYILQISSVNSSTFLQRNCSLYFPSSCEETETCVQKEVGNIQGYCACKRNFILKNKKCIPKPVPFVPIPPSSSSAVISPDPHISAGATGTLWVLVPCLLLGIVGALILVSRRYKLMERLYSLRLRRYNTVFVSSLNDDDAPIT